MPRKKLKLMVAQVAKPETPKGDSEIAALQALQVHPGWMVMMRIMGENPKFLEDCILDQIDPLTKKELDSEEVEKLRYKRNITKEFMDTPRNYMKLLGDTEEEPDHDPYFHTGDEIRKSRSLKP